MQATPGIISRPGSVIRMKLVPKAASVADFR
jgi:hypothetical protein